MAEKVKKVVFRNPIYIVYMLLSFGLYLLVADIATRGVDPFELTIFKAINQLPDIFILLFLPFSIFGTIGFALAVSIYNLFKKRYIPAAEYFLAGTIAYVTAYGLKLLEYRARPELLVDNPIVRENAAATFGFPSGHVAVATALAIIMYQYTPAKFHKYITGSVVLVALSRLFLGVHLPIDLIGGYAIGLFVGSALSYGFGRRIVARVSVEEVKAALRLNSFAFKEVKALNVDARGSSPFIVTDTDGGRYFLKVVNSDNFIADWLFKSWRKFVYKRLEDEAPYFSPKRQIEHESYVAGLAYTNRIRTPRIVTVLEVKENNWAQIQEAVDGVSLDKVEKSKISDKVLNDVFALVADLHKQRIIHRDLRAANIFLDTNNKPWLIDFGFAEASIKSSQTYRDLVEMLGSLGVIVGAKRVVKAAVKHIPKDQLENALGYMVYASMSSETTRLLKQNKALLSEIKEELKNALGLKEVKQVQLQRISMKAVIIIVGFILFVYFLISQQEDFKNSITAIKEADIRLLGISIVFSVLTYFAASMVYKLIAIYPLPYFKTLIVQISSSFTNRLLPAGTGGLATFSRYLITQGHSQQQAVALATVNNIFGFIGMMLLTISVALISKTPLNQAVRLTIPTWVYILTVAILIVATIIIVVSPKIRKFAKKTAKNVLQDFKLIAAKPAQLIFALLFSMLITMSYAAVLYTCIHALGADATVLQTFIVLTVGVAAASVTPTPGGIGGAEAGLVAGLTSIGIGADIGLSIALAYRFATFWLPILPGFIAFQFALKKKIL